jgi:hypothetical protein
MFSFLSTTGRRLCLLGALAGCLTASAHAQIDPSSTAAIDWSRIANAGAPTAPCPTSTVKVGQPYLDTTNNINYTCGPSGWFQGSGSSGSGFAQCSDTSGSGTVQNCTTSPSFTPAANQSCILYHTTTANSGTGLTVNVNSLGAKSVAIAGASGWTTTLTAGVIPSAKPVTMCYDGTNWDVLQTGTAANSGGGTVTPPAYIFTTNGTTVNAINGLTAAVDYTGTDAAVVVNAAMNNIAATCGTLYFKSGIYPVNSLTHETTTTTGITNLPWYAFGIPANTGTSNQFCAWRFEGEQPTMWAGESGLPLQTDGVIFNITSTAIATATSGNLIAGIWNRPAALFSGFIVGSQDYFSNITVRFPTNQRGNEVGIYPATAATVDYHNTLTDFAIQYSSLAAPVAGTIGSIGMTSTISNQGNVQNFTNTYAVGFDTGYSFLSEHVGGSDVTSIYSNTACKFGDTFNGASKGVLHAIQIHHLIDQENINGCALGANMTAGSQINLDALDIETAPSGTWTRVNNMTETNAGNSTGIITYSRIVVGGSAPSTLTLWTTGGTNFMSLDSKASGGFSGVKSNNINGLLAVSGDLSLSGAGTPASPYTIGHSGAGGCPFQEYDTFISAPGTLLSAHTSDCSHTWTQWTAGLDGSTNTLQLNGGGLVLSGTGISSYYNSLTPSSADYTAWASCMGAGGSTACGVWGRLSTGSDNGYLVNNTLGTCTLYKVVSGTATQLGSTGSCSWVAGEFHTLALKMTGSTIAMYVDGTSITSATDATFASAGAAGIRGTSASNGTVAKFGVN